MASIPQSRNRLENRRGKNDEVSRRVWKAVEASSGEVRLGETEGERREGRSMKEKRGKDEEEEKTKERKDDGGEESSRRVGDLGGRGRDSKIWDGNKKVGARKVSQMDKNIWEKTI